MSKGEMPVVGSGPAVRGALGIHLDVAALYVVEIARGHVVRSLQAPYPAGVEPGSETFAAFLKQSLADFIPTYRRPPVWVVGPIPSLQVRFLSIPKVRASQVSKLVYWTFRKEIPFDAAQTVFDYDLEGDSIASGQVRKLEATAYTAAQADLDVLAGMFEEIGIPLEGIVIPSFALRNLFRLMPAHEGGTYLALYAGAEDSALLIFKGRQVVSHRVFKTGMNILLGVMREQHPEWSASQAFEAIRAILGQPFGSGMPPDTEDARGTCDALQQSFGRLIQQVERTVSAYLAGKAGEEIQGLHVGGALAGLPALVQELGAQLGLKCQPIQPLRTSAGNAKPPEATPEQAGLSALALGAALSDNARTPNLLHTYIKREQIKRLARTRKLVMAFGIVALAAIGLLHVFASRHNLQLRKELRERQEQMARYSPQPDRARIGELVNTAMADNLKLKAMVDRNLMSVVLNQIARDTPQDIQWTAITLERTEEADAAGQPGQRKGRTATDDEPALRVRLEGTVQGESGIHASKLAAYQMRLEASELLEQVELAKVEEARDGTGPVLLFTLDMNVEGFAAAFPADKTKAGPP